MQVLYNGDSNQFLVLIEGQPERVIAPREVANLLTQFATRFEQITAVLEVSTVPNPTVVIERQ